MAKTISGVNPKILTWARTQAGLSLNDVANRMKRHPETIKSWEEGESSPTYSQLERLAYVLYKRPLALFFFPEPPDEPSPDKSFRTLPESEAEKLAPDTRFKLREARLFQLSLAELNDGANPAERKIFRDIVVNESSPQEASRVAELVRSYLELEVEVRSQWRSIAEWFKRCRIVIEDAGVFVFKNSFKQKEVSGLCLYDEEFPVIYINNSTTAARQVFTLFHELGHILLHINGITQLDDSYVNALGADDKRIEIFCNRFAAEVLIPEEDFEERVGDLIPDEPFIIKLSKRYKVSREVVLRRFLDLGRVTQEKYEESVEKWNKEAEESRSKEPGSGNYYSNQIAYLGEKYLDLAFSRYHQGAISEQRLADFLGMKPQTVANLEQTYMERVTG
jgi:Zn-dependent peptidase ImmA (M78 family)